MFNKLDKKIIKIIIICISSPPVISNILFDDLPPPFL